MQRTTTILAALAVAALASPPSARARQAQPPAPERAAVEQQAMQQGPATGRIGYRTHKDPPAAKHAAAPDDPAMLKPLTQREIGMLFNACIAYPECKTAYAKAYEHNQALLRATRG